MADENTNLGTTNIGMRPNVAGFLCYLLGVLTGIIFLIAEKQNKFVRFHAMQSIIVFGGLFVINLFSLFVPVLGALISVLVSITSLFLWIILMIKAYMGEYFKAPMAGNLAEKYA